MTEEQRQESAAFARVLQQLIEDHGGHYTACIFRQVDGAIFAKMLHGSSATLDGYDPTILLTNGEASHIRELRAKVTCELAGRK